MTLAVTAGLLASSNASAVMIKSVSQTVTDTLTSVQNVFKIMAASPAKPAAPTAVGGNKSATVTWTAPANNGAAITSYTVTSFPGEFTCTVSSLSCVISGLSNETAYAFTVTATNSLGESLRSTESAPTTPTHTPRLLNAIPETSGQTNAVVHSADGRYAIWGTATSPAQIVKYDLKTKSIAETLILDAATKAITHASASDTQAYFFYSGGYVAVDIEGMFVTNAKTWSNKTVSVVDSNGTYIYAQNVTYGQLRKFDAASGNQIGEMSLVGHIQDILVSGTNLFVVRDDFNSKLVIDKVDASTMTKVGSSLTLSQEKVGVGYWRVHHELLDDGSTSMLTFSSNDQFSSTSGNKVYMARVNLSTMTLGQVKTSDNGRDAYWYYSAASWDGAAGYGYVFNNSTTGSEGYLNKVRISDLAIVSRTQYAAKPTVQANSEAVVLSSIYDGRIFSFSTATSSGWMREYAIGDVPNEPTGLSAEYGDQQATLTWLEPSDLGAGTNVRYKAQSTAGDFSCVTTQLTCVVTGLTNGTSYVFKVTATTTVGDGSISAATSVTPKRAPDAPLSTTATYRAASASVRWLAPANNGGSAIVSYTVRANPGGHSCTTTTLDCVVPGLTNGSTYTFSATASNVAGTSVPSANSNSVTPRSFPSSPRSVTGTFGNKQVAVAWSVPTTDGGAPITDYLVVSNPGSKTCTADAMTFTCNVTGLVNGTSYTFAVQARNSEGFGSSSASGSVVPATKPTPPSTPSITSVGNGTISLNWNAPVDNGGSAVTGYRVTANPGGQTCVTTTARVCTIAGLANGTPYSLSATASNTAGTSDASAESASSTPRTNPGAPTGLTATYGNTSVTLSWTAPDDNGGLAISSYKVTTAGNVTKTCSTSAPVTSCIVGGLINGTSYSFSVTATNGASLASVSSVSASAVPKTTPGAPFLVSLTSQNTSIKVTWEEKAFNGGASVTGFVATATPGDISCTTTSTFCTITGLVNGTSYSVKVVSSNEVGSGTASNIRSSIPNVAPAAPSSVELVASPTKLLATWTAPAPNGGTEILAYRATATPGNKFCEAMSPSTSCEITGLVNGTGYTVSVSARNAHGLGAESSSSSSATPLDAPYSPNAPTVTVGDEKLTLRWIAPGDGGSPILSYLVTDVNDPNISCTVSAPITSCEIAGLENGTEYRFKVSAKNSIGDSLFSAPSSATAPFGLPDAPDLAELRYASGSITLAWFRPISDGGTPVLGYVITASPGGKTCSTVQLQCVITGLTNGTSYTFTAQARNKIGLGDASVPSDQVTPWAAPSAPTGIKATADESAAIVSWIAPLNTDFETTSYVVTSVPGAFECEVSAETECRVGGLENGIAYAFRVVATNNSGSSNASSISNTATPRTTPDAPQQVIPRVISTGIEVNWIAPDFNGGANISFYTATAQPGGLTCVTSSTGCVVQGLTRGIEYSISVTASNVAGASLESLGLDSITFGAVPAKPNSVFAIAGAGNATISWNAPFDNGGSEIVYYVVESTPGGFICVVEGLSCVITGLTNSTKYTFTVRAANGLGESDNSILSAPVSPVAKPGQPSVVESVFISYDQLLVSWTAASANVNFYRVILQKPNYPYTEIDATTVDSSILTHTFEGLSPGSAYRAQVIAYGVGSAYIRAASAPARKFGPVLFTQYPTVGGAPVVGKTLLANDGAFVGVPAPRLTRSWYRCSVVQLEQSPLTKDCSVIKGATSGKYKLTPADINKFIAFGVTATNAYGDTVAYGVVSGRVASAPIANKASTISGIAKSARVLTGNPGTWTGSSGITYKYQWMRCTVTYKATTSKGPKCAAISQATKLTYKLAASDVGKFVRLVVTASNNYGKAEVHTATSAKVAK